MGEQVADGWLRLTIQEPLLGPRTPRVHVDATPVRTVPGENLIPLPVGLHVIDVTAPWRSHAAEAEFHVRAGQVTDLWYAPPFARGARGTIGTRPQPNHAMRYLTLVGAIITIGLLLSYLR